MLGSAACCRIKLVDPDWKTGLGVGNTELGPLSMFFLDTFNRLLAF